MTPLLAIVQAVMLLDLIPEGYYVRQATVHSFLESTVWIGPIVTAITIFYFQRQPGSEWNNIERFSIFPTWKHRGIHLATILLHTWAAQLLGFLGVVTYLEFTLTGWGSPSVPQLLLPFASSLFYTIVGYTIARITPAWYLGPIGGLITFFFGQIWLFSTGRLSLLWPGVSGLVDQWNTPRPDLGLAMITWVVILSIFLFVLTLPDISRLLPLSVGVLALIAGGWVVSFQGMYTSLDIPSFEHSCSGDGTYEICLHPASSNFRDELNPQLRRLISITADSDIPIGPIMQTCRGTGCEIPSDYMPFSIDSAKAIDDSLYELISSRVDYDRCYSDEQTVESINGFSLMDLVAQMLAAPTYRDIDFYGEDSDIAATLSQFSDEEWKQWWSEHALAWSRCELRTEDMPS